VSFVLIALVWGIGASLLTISIPLTQQAIVFAFLLGMAGGAVSTYSVHPVSVTLGLLCLMIPVMFRFAWEKDIAHSVMLFAALIYLIATYRSTRLLSHFFRQSYELNLSLESAKDEAERLARTDVLTGMYNRRAFYELGESALNQARRYNRPLTVLMLDIDRFKSINDNYGHAIGDAAIKAFANVIRETHRMTDISGRVGGEEFAILMPETSLQEAAELAERLRQKIAETLIKVEDKNLRITSSLGVAECNDKSNSLDALMASADLALYKAKETGRNKVVVSGADL
jgi:diguanylate cyclase (GGDEF)-like protein